MTELTKEDINSLIAIVNQSSFQGASAEYVVELKNKLKGLFLEKKDENN